MANISVWVFDNSDDADAYTQKEKGKGRKVIGPTELGSVDVTKHAGAQTSGVFFKDFTGKWGVAVLG